MTLGSPSIGKAKWNQEGKGANKGCANEPVTALAGWVSIPSGTSGRSYEITLYLSHLRKPRILSSHPHHHWWTLLLGALLPRTPSLTDRAHNSPALLQSITAAYKEAGNIFGPSDCLCVCVNYLKSYFKFLLFFFFTINTLPPARPPKTLNWQVTLMPLIKALLDQKRIK